MMVDSMYGAIFGSIGEYLGVENRMVRYERNNSELNRVGSQKNFYHLFLIIMSIFLLISIKFLVLCQSTKDCIFLVICVLVFGYTCFYCYWYIYKGKTFIDTVEIEIKYVSLINIFNERSIFNVNDLSSVNELRFSLLERVLITNKRTNGFELEFTPRGGKKSIFRILDDIREYEYLKSFFKEKVCDEIC